MIDGASHATRSFSRYDKSPKTFWPFVVLILDGLSSCDYGQFIKYILLNLVVYPLIIRLPTISAKNYVENPVILIGLTYQSMSTKGRKLIR